VNIMEFCKAFNEKTKDLMGYKVPVVITVYADKSFTFITKQPPVSELILKTAGIGKGADNPLKNKVGKLTQAQVMDIVNRKIVDMNTTDKAAATKTVSGSARSMGVDIID